MIRNDALVEVKTIPVIPHKRIALYKGVEWMVGVLCSSCGGSEPETDCKGCVFQTVLLYPVEEKGKNE